MPTLDATAKTAAAGPAFAAAYYIYLNIDVDPLRVTTFGADTTFSGTGDADLDGLTYIAWGGQALEIGEVADTDSGSESMVVRLSGITSIDTELINDIGDRAKWQGRLCRIWMRLYDETGVTAQGAVIALYTGYLSSVRIGAEPDMQFIELTAEKYLAFFSEASNRSYLNQKDYDANDNSAAATIAASNGLRRDTGAVGGNPQGSGMMGGPGGKEGFYYGPNTTKDIY